MTLFQKFLNDTSGAAAAEYSVLLIIIVLVILAFGTVFGDAVVSRFQETSDDLNAL